MAKKFPNFMTYFVSIRYALRWRERRRWIALFCCLFLTGCGAESALINIPAEPTVTPGPSPTPPFLGDLPSGWIEAMDVGLGICFESAQGAAFDEAVFVLRSDTDLQRLYDLADNSGLCEFPVERVPFDFSSGLTIAGTWSDGFGCDARHDIVDVQRDDSAQTLAITLRHVTSGDCPYELVRPWWVAIPGVREYEISVTVLE